MCTIGKSVRKITFAAQNDGYKTIYYDKAYPTSAFFPETRNKFRKIINYTGFGNKFWYYAFFWCEFCHINCFGACVSLKYSSNSAC